MAEKERPMDINISDPLAGDPCPLLGECSATKHTGRKRLPLEECTEKAFKNCGLNPEIGNKKGGH
jgi:hypothetical protein